MICLGDSSRPLPFPVPRCPRRAVPQRHRSESLRWRYDSVYRNAPGQRNRLMSTLNVCVLVSVTPLDQRFWFRGKAGGFTVSVVSHE